MNGGFGKDFYRKGNSVKRSRRFSEPPDSEVKSCCPHPLPENQLLVSAPQTIMRQVSKPNKACIVHQVPRASLHHALQDWVKQASEHPG